MVCRRWLALIAGVVIFVYAAVLAAISGFLYAPLRRAVNPTPFGRNHGIEYLFMAVVGGVSHVGDAILGPLSSLFCRRVFVFCG